GKSPDKYNSKREIFSACAAAAIYRRSILEKIGYLDENFFAYLEDVDISYRARINGYKCFYTPSAVAYHVGSATSGGRYNAFKIKLAARNNIFLVYKNLPWPQLVLNLPFLVLGFFIKYIFFIIKGYGKTYHNGIKEGLSNLSKIKKTEYERENLINYLKIEYLLIKNTLKFIFY
ncbi:MAG: glycosyltransferase family 2 protein, partial [Methanobacterium sp.]|nr:glycosyltransferase family 2 protein [Methanobacterium sp.]